MHYEVVAASAMLSAFTMPFILNIAHKKGLYDVAGGRKRHDGLIPRLGGIGMFVAFMAIMLIISFLQPGYVADQLSGSTLRLLSLAIGALLMHMVGLIDDLKSLPARFKLIIQVMAAVIVVAGGYGFKGLGFKADSLSGEFSWLSIVVSIGWIVGVTNAINLIDGLDGLAGSLAFIASFAFGIFYYRVGDILSSLVCLCVAGVVVGFLFFNFPMPKAKLFMGDSGSLFLGYSLAVMPFLGQVRNPDSSMLEMGLLPSIAILALPIFDTLRVMALRISEGRSIMSSDRLHVHYLFADSGYSSLEVIAILGFMSMMLAIAVLVSSAMPRSIGYLVEIIAMLCLCIFFRYARYVGARKVRE